MLASIPYTPAANRAVDVINTLTHAKAKWARQKFNLRPWQENQIIRPLFGTLRADGSRQYRKSLIFLPRKNGKSELAAAIALYMLVSEQEEGGEIYGAATDREQASLVFNVAAQMVRNDATLSRLCKITESQRKIVYSPTNSFYRAIPADAPHAHGYNASAVIYDELHAAPNSALWDVLTTSMGARSQPLTVAITTAGYDKDSICYQVYNYACQVRDGIVEDPSFLPVIFEAPPESDWKDETTWHAANPALGDFRNIEEMRELAREAMHMPARQTVFEQLYLNRWTESASRWIADEAWTATAGEIDTVQLEGEMCWAGLDLAYRDDFAALVLLFQSGDEFTLLPFIFAPSEGKRDWRVEPFASWKRAGLIDFTDGNTTDFARIKKTIFDCASRFNIQKLAYDPWNATQLGMELAESGIATVEFGQNMRNMTAPTKQFEALVLGKKLRHGNHAVLRWMLSNTCVETDASGNYRPSKKKSSEKIDGIVAAIMALGVNMVSEPVKTSIYESRGVLQIGDEFPRPPAGTPATPRLRQFNWHDV